MARQEKVIGHPLDARVSVIPTKELEWLIKEEARNLKESLIISQLIVGAEEGGRAFESKEIPGLKVYVVPAKGKKCERCWNFSEKVGENKEHPVICERCVEAIG